MSLGYLGLGDYYEKLAILVRGLTLFVGGLGGSSLPHDVFRQNLFLILAAAEGSPLMGING